MYTDDAPAESSPEEEELTLVCCSKYEYMHNVYINQLDATLLMNDLYYPLTFRNLASYI